MGVCLGWTDKQAAWQLAPRGLIHARASGGDEQRLADDGPLPTERMKTRGDEVATHTINRIEQAVRDGRPSLTWCGPTLAHLRSHFWGTDQAMLGTKDRGRQAVVMPDLDDHVGEILGQPSTVSPGEVPEGVAYCGGGAAGVESGPLRLANGRRATRPRC
jgi:arylsulfatase